MYILKKCFTTERERYGKPVYLFLCVIIGLALFPFWPTTHAAVPDSRLAPAAVEQYAQQQANALGTSDPEWLAAKFDYYPLGPGTHGWFVHASIQDKPVGYMIISITSQGELILSEYGKGEQALYNIELLGQALERQDLSLSTLQASGGKLTRHYAFPLLAYWKVERIHEPALYIDASNGDLLPDAVLERIETTFERQTQEQSFNLTEPEKKQVIPAVTTWITSPLHLQPAFDPSQQLTWLTSEPLQISQVQQQIQRIPTTGHTDSLIFSAGERNLFYGGPLPISGYQIWHMEETAKVLLYIGLGGFNSTQRFVPINTLLNDGHFYFLTIRNSS